MLAEDLFRTWLADLVAKLEDWAARYRDTGDMDIKHGAGFWRVVARPHTPGTCPATLVLRADQKFDLSLAGDVFEDRPIDDFELFAPLLEAVARGDVQRTYYSCAVTGAKHGHETRVLLANRPAWGELRLPSGARIDDDSIVEECVRFLPYRR